MLSLVALTSFRVTVEGNILLHFYIIIERVVYASNMFDALF
jgi:hypothetical protein